MYTDDEIFHRAVIWDRYMDRKAPRGVVLAFHGLNCTSIASEPVWELDQWEKKGWLVVMPYCGPWSWMNAETRAYVDRLLTVIWDRYGLEENTKLVLYGWSMGGYAALLYSTYTDRRICKMILRYPACDLRYHYSERIDTPISLQAAFWSYTNFEQLWKEQSPMERIDKLPDVPYLFFHSKDDTKVSKTMHSDRMVAELKKRGYRVVYLESEGYDHHVQLRQEDIDRIAAFLDD